MAFTSINFLIFVLCAVCIYYIAPVKYRWVVLLVASYAFYLMSSPKTIVFMIATTIITFLGGLWLDSCNKQHKAYLSEHKAELSRDEKKALKSKSQNKKRKITALILVLDFGILAALKYFGATLQMWGILDTGELLIPMGISFYTFQSAAYIFDIYRSKIEADRNVAKFALYTSFFPQIIQGPISRYDQLANQLYEGHKFDFDNLTYGAQLMLWGFFKKLIVADRVSVIVAEVYDGDIQYAGLPVVMGMLAYTIQIYADFSGGIDIARGVAQCMGIEMTHNFRRPCFAGDLSDFWNRWHISLSHWCRDYIFYPVAMSKVFGKMGKSLRKLLGDRVGKLFPVIIAQYCTFITIGIWHGAAFKYVAYGLYNGTIIVLGLLLEPAFKKIIGALKIKTESWWWKGFRIVRTFIIVMVGRVFPRAASFGAAITTFGVIFDASTTVTSDVEGELVNSSVPILSTLGMLGFTFTECIILAVALVIWFLISLYEERSAIKNGGDGTSAVRELLASWPIVLRWLVLLLGFAMVLVVGVYGPGYDASAFIYRGF